MSLYAKLAEKLNHFVCLDTMSTGSVLRNSGLLIEATPDYFTLRTYDEETGEPTSEFSAPISIIVGLWFGHKDEQKLSALVSWAVSEKEAVK